MVTYDERNNAIHYIASNYKFDEKAENALSCAMEAFSRMKVDDCMLNKSTMAMNIAHLTLYLEAIQNHYSIPACSVDGWIDVFVNDENRKENGGV